MANFKSINVLILIKISSQFCDGSLTSVLSQAMIIHLLPVWVTTKNAQKTCKDLAIFCPLRPPSDHSALNRMTIVVKPFQQNNAG